MNMSYCRFQNTYLDLKDCLEYLQDNNFETENLSDEELRAYNRLVQTCKEIIEGTEK